MSLSSDSAVLTMPVQPANTNGSNGFGFGNDGAWWVIILFLFAFCGGWGGNRPGNGCTDHGTADTALCLCHRQIVRSIRIIPSDFIKAVNHARAFITTAVSNAKQPVGFVNRHKESVSIIDGIGFFEHLPTLF